MLAAPRTTETQQADKVRRIGYLQSAPPPLPAWTEVMRTRLRELGWIEGKALVIEYRFVEHVDELMAAVVDLLRLEVDVIVAPSTPGANAAKQATKTVPIVMQSGDPIAAGLVKSFARPGTNVTGVASQLPELRPKSLEILLGVVPKASRIGLLMMKDNLATEVSWRELQKAAS
jgi:putative ABC transport system substrate-binding protein